MKIRGWNKKKAAYLLATFISAIMTTTLFNNCSKSQFETIQEASLGEGVFDSKNSCAMPDGSTLKVGEELVGYPLQSSVYPSLCGQPVTRTCMPNGQLDGALVYNSCSQQCVHPDNQQPNSSGTVYTYYTLASAASQAECEASKKTANCDAGTGTFIPQVPATRYSVCKVVAPAVTCSYPANVAGYSVPTGNSVGSTVTGFKMATATYPTLCGSAMTLTCGANGAWSGAVPVYMKCDQKCVHPDTGAPVAVGTSYTYFKIAAGYQAQCDSSKVTSVCQTNGVFSPAVPVTRTATCSVKPDPFFLTSVSSQTSSGPSVMFMGQCITGVPIIVSGTDSTTIASTALNGCSAGKWFYVTNAQSTDAKRTYTFSQTDPVTGVKFTLTGTWTRDTVNSMYNRRVAIANSHTFPKLAKIYYQSGPAFDANFGTLVKFDYVVFGMWNGWNDPKLGGGIRNAILAMKAANPNAFVANYTIINESRKTIQSAGDSAAEVINKLNSENWWLRKADGTMVQWTNSFDAWDINLTDWTKADASGVRWPVWAARWYYKVYFQNVPEFDLWFMDNVFDYQRIDYADWKRIGYDQDNTAAARKAMKPETLEVNLHTRLGHVSEWDEIHKLTPQMMLIGNSASANANTEYTNKMESALYECAIGKSWSIETWAGWEAMMADFRKMTDNLKAPKMAMFGLCPASMTDYKMIRYGFATALLTNAYIDISGDYQNITWYDEYDAKLGAAVDAPPLTPNLPGKNAAGAAVSIYKRVFQKGMAIVNPTTSAVTVTVPAGYKRIMGKQDPSVNNGQPVTTLTIPSRDGIVLIPQ